MVALDVLFDELLDAGCKQGQRALLFPLLERDLIVERPREQVFEVRRECRRLRFGPFAIAGVSFGPLVFPWWAAWTDLVLLLWRGTVLLLDRLSDSLLF